MSAINDSGKAFPLIQGPYNEGQTGMTLRDWFAGQALANPALVHILDFQNTTPEERTAIRCYRYADAMIAERNKTI